MVFDSQSISAVSEDSDIIVSLTPFPARINKFYFMVYSLRFPRENIGTG